MANRLKMALAQSIHTLYQQGWSQRRIARELGINRETVARHLKDLQPAPKPANAPLGWGEDQVGSKPANAPLGPPTMDSDFCLAPASWCATKGKDTQDRRSVFRPNSAPG
jgi:hypothetical protein